MSSEHYGYIEGAVISARMASKMLLEYIGIDMAKSAELLASHKEGNSAL